MLAGTAGLLPRSAAAEPPPEVTTLRLTSQRGAICIAPKYVAEELLQAEGFADIRYAEEERLSARVQMLASGKTNREIAEQLHISVSTVETHRNNVFQKLHLHNLAELILYAVRKGLIS